MSRRRDKYSGIPGWQIRYLETGELPRETDPRGPVDDGVNVFELLQWQYPDHRLEVRAVWEAVRERILPAWIERHPGSRPHGYWIFDADLELKRDKVHRAIVYGRGDSIPENQRAWLAERDLLEAGE